MGSELDISPHHPLRGFFAVLTERSFYEQIGWPDDHVVGYIADLLATFVEADRVYLFRGVGRGYGASVLDMLRDIESGRSGIPERDVHRHIGDFTLFMVGLFPERVARLKRESRFVDSDGLLDYVKVGKRSYRLVSELPEEGNTQEGALFRKLSEHFELCVEGLGCIREDLRSRALGGGGNLPPRPFN